MPTYAYLCKDCGYSFEQIQSFSEPSIDTCQKCKGKVKKLYNQIGVVFKGSGFYRNDSRGKNSSSGSTTTNSSESSTSKSKNETRSADNSSAKKSEAKKAE